MRALLVLPVLLATTGLSYAQQDVFRHHLEAPILFSGTGGPTSPPQGIAPDLEPISASNGTLNEAWSLSPTLANAATGVAWTISPPLPTGLSLNGSTGAITGTAGEMRISTAYTLRAENAHGHDSESFSFTVYDKVSMTDLSLDLDVDDELSETLVAVGGDGSYTFEWDSSSPARPSWLQLVDGVLSGTAAAGTVEDLVIRVRDGENRWDTALLDVVVRAASGWLKWGEGNSTPTIVPDIADMTNVGHGAGFGCGMRSGEVWCWGSANRGQLGNGATTATNSPPVKAAGLSGVSKLVVGQYHSCAIAGSNNQLYCWGNNLNRQVANNSTQSITIPTLNGEFSNVSAVATGLAHSCAISGSYSFCWGNNSNGALGNGNTTANGSAQMVRTSSSAYLTNATGIHAGTDFSCATFSDGRMSCWGTSYFGQTGLGSMPNSTPYATPIANNSGGITQVSMAGEYMCFLRSGTPYCAGRNSSGQLGRGNTNEISTPAQFGSLTGVAKIVATEATTCALRTDGTVWCSGNHSYGQMAGHGSASLVPVQIPDLSGITDIAGTFRSFVVKG